MWELDAIESDQRWTRVSCLPSVQRLTPAGITYLQSALRTGPSRKVGKGSLFSNSGGYPADGGLVGYESEGGELTFILLSEWDDRTKLLLSQPPPLRVLAHDSRGRSRTQPHTPDYLVVSDDEVAVVEVKHLPQLQVKGKTYPDDWICDESGKWRYLPGEQSSVGLGISYRVFNPDVLTHQYRANLRYLLELKRTPPACVSERLLRGLRETLLERPRSIRDLLARFVHVTGDQVVDQVVKGKLFGSFEHQTISSEFIVYGSLEQLNSAISCIKRARLVVDDNEFLVRLARATKTERRHAEEAIRRYEERRDAGVRMNSTDYRHRAAMGEATAAGAPAIAGLLPKFSQRGGEGTPVKPEHRKFVMNQVREYMKEAHGKISPSNIHADLMESSNGDWQVPCIETLRRWIAHELTPERQASLSGGPRVIQKAKRKTEGAHCLERVTVGGTWAHIDAVYGDIVPRSDSEWDETRPIFFPLVLVPSLYIPAVGVTFGRPSSLGLVMALRLCAQHHGFLPLCVCCDRGTEFENDLRRELSSHYAVQLMRRPTADSRVGAEAEAVQGKLNAFLQTLPGGTYHDQAGRSSDGKLKGRRTAKYSPEESIQAALDWVEVWNSGKHGNASENPRDALAREIELFPGSVRRVQPGEDFAYLTSYPIDASSYTYERGLSFGGKRYACDLASELIHRGHQPSDFRLDAIDPSVIRAQSSKGLLRLTANNHHRVAGMSLPQRVLALSELLRYHRVSKKSQAENRRAHVVLRKKQEALAAPTVPSEAADAPHPDKANAEKRPLFSEMSKMSRAPLVAVEMEIEHEE